MANPSKRREICVLNTIRWRLRTFEEGWIVDQSGRVAWLTLSKYWREKNLIGLLLDNNNGGRRSNPTASPPSPIKLNRDETNCETVSNSVIDWAFSLNGETKLWRLLFRMRPLLPSCVGRERAEDKGEKLSVRRNVIGEGGYDCQLYVSKLYISIITYISPSRVVATR